MGDFTQSKGFGTAIYPVHALVTSGLLKRVEPFLTPELLRSRFLKGIPMFFPNGDLFSDDELKDQINIAVNNAELLLDRPIIREQYKEKVPFDYSLYKSYIHIKAEHGPIVSIEHLAIVSADDQAIFEIPPTWIETANFSKNQINVIPLLAAYGINQVSGAVGNAGIAFLTVMDGLGWVPAYWQIKYTAGLSTVEGLMPVPVNELIGIIAAINVLSIIAPMFLYNSQTLSQDGISQSSSGMGPRQYQLRIQELEARKAVLVSKLRGVFSGKFFISNF